MKQFAEADDGIATLQAQRTATEILAGMGNGCQQAGCVSGCCTHVRYVMLLTERSIYAPLDQTAPDSERFGDFTEACRHLHRNLGFRVWKTSSVSVRLVGSLTDL